MTEPLSILDKIIEAEKNKQLNDLDVLAEVNFLLSNPKIKKDRDKEVISLRFGLNGDKAKTLEEIGKSLNITRERVRQIEKATYTKIADFAESEKRTQKIISLINSEIEKLGKVVTFGNLSEVILCEDSHKHKCKNALAFLMTLNKKAVQLPDTSSMKRGYFLDSEIKLADIEKIHNISVEILDDKKAPVEEKKLVKMIKEKGHEFEDSTIVAVLSLSKNIIRTEEGHFGLSHWREINPKSIKDKTYYILRKHNKPLHFDEISKHVEKMNENKKVTKQAVHNELIRDERFVLIGRGIYALKEWGYKDGVIEEVITEILIEAGGPLHKDIIISEVKKRRIVKDTTILLNLQKDKFKRVSRATYTINK